jgi:hypothetical protein
MDPTTAAALIGVGGAVLVAVVGSVTTARTIRQSLADGRLSARAALDAGHEERIWDKKAELYVELLRDERGRRGDRGNRRRDYQDPAEHGERPPGPVAPHSQQDWLDFEARVMAFGSDPVMEAFQEAREASLDVHNRDKEWQAYDQPLPATGTPPPSQPRDAVIDAMARADAADKLLADRIRKELQAPLFATVPLRPAH